METILSIYGKMEYLESLVKLAKNKKDKSLKTINLMKLEKTPTIRYICINKSHQSKTLHLLVHVGNHLIEGLVDTSASMLLMVKGVVQKLGIMHLVIGSKSYKITFDITTQALGRINEIVVIVGKIQCPMTSMVINTNIYDILLGLDFLIKIGVVVDVESKELSKSSARSWE